MAEGCRCQECGFRYKVDLLVPNYIWERIKPMDKDQGAGLLCGPCIARAIERMGVFGCYQLWLIPT